MKQDSLRRLCTAGLIAALYAALSLGAGALGLGYGPIQFRFSEALCLLPFFFPQAAGGLFVGCVLANLISPYGLLDMIVGSMATLLAGVLSARCQKPWQAAVPPVICNAVLVGAVIAVQQTAVTTETFGAAYAFHALTVGLGETAVCFGLGLPLVRWMEKNGMGERLRILSGKSKQK